jgi:hypothetical protein
MVTSYKLIYFCLSTIRILPNKLVHQVTVQIHSSPPAAPAAAATAHNARAATVATSRYIIWCSQRIAEENEVGRRSRYVFLNLYDFFHTICRMLLCMIFSNHIRTCNTDLYVGTTLQTRIIFIWQQYTNSYISPQNKMTTYGYLI